jgi:Phytanoyl-CoA dioxygenase (PhyH)
MKLFTRTPSADLEERPFPESKDELFAEIDELQAASRRRPNVATQRRLLRLRHLAGFHMVDDAPGEAEYANPEDSRLPEYNGSLPEFSPSEVTSGLLRAAILRDGVLLVRGLLDRSEASQLARGIESTFVARDKHDAGQKSDPEYYEEFKLDPRLNPFLGRTWMKMGGGVMGADSPRVSFDLSAAMRRVGIPQLASSYLGEPALLSIQKTTLRKAEPQVPGSWHQDGKFMGNVRALNLWVALSHCGDTAPGMDLVPTRLNDFAQTNTDEATIDTMVSQRVAREAAGERGIIRPIFEPGDALLFDEMFLHQTASDPAMPNPRYALEVWMFGGSVFPEVYAPMMI